MNGYTFSAGASSFSKGSFQYQGLGWELNQGGKFAQFLKQGSQGGVCRNLLSVEKNLFRKSSSRFYSVQNAKNITRLRNCGNPWPKGLDKASIGQGLYTWATRREASEYLLIKFARALEQGRDASVEGLQIITLRIANSRLGNFSKLDLSKVSGKEFQYFIDNFTSYGKGCQHGFQNVIYPREKGVEVFFSKDVFKYFYLK